MNFDSQESTNAEKRTRSLVKNSEEYSVQTFGPPLSGLLFKWRTTMLISELIAKLQLVQTVNGDREIGVVDKEGALREPELVRYYYADKPDDIYSVSIS